MADLDENKKNILIKIIDVYTPFLRKMLEHLRRKQDPKMKTSLDKLSYVYQIFTEGDTKEKLDVYNACQDMLEKWYQKYKDIRIQKPEAKTPDDTKKSGNPLSIAVSSIRSVPDDKDKFYNNGGTIFTKENETQISTIISSEIMTQTVKNIKQEKTDSTLTTLLSTTNSYTKPIQAVTPQPATTPASTPAATSENKDKDKETVFVCASCQFRTTNEVDFMKHARTDHRTDLSLWCKNCGKCFSNAGVLVSHIKEANCQKEEMIYRCGVKDCTFETPSGQTFVHHLRHCHKGSPFIFCVHCQKIFTLPHCLILHMQNDCPFKEKNRRNPGEYRPPEPATPPTVPTFKPITPSFTPAPRPQVPKIISPSISAVTKSPVVAKPINTPAPRPVIQRKRGRPSSGRFSRNSRYEDSSDSDDPDDPSWRPEETMNNAPLRRSARWASRVSEAKDPEIDTAGSIVPRKKRKTIEQPASTIVHCPCCNFSAAFKSLLDEHYIASHKHEKRTACMVCNVKFENTDLFIKHFENHEKNTNVMVPNFISESSNDSTKPSNDSTKPDNAVAETSTSQEKPVENQSDNLKDIPVESSHEKLVDNLDKITKIPYQTAIHEKLTKENKTKCFEDLKAPADITKMLQEPKLRHFFKCTAHNCTYTTDDDKFFALHIDEKHAEKKIHCTYCYEEFNASQPLVDHMFSMHSKRCYQCSACFYRAFSKAHVQIHIKNAHPSTKPLIYTCALHLPSNFVFQEKVENNEPTTFPYVCAISECRYKTFNPKEFTKHNELEHRSCTQFFCHYCKGDFVSLKKLLSHYHLHGINNFQCTYCVHGSETRDEILLHLCNCHADKAFKVYFRTPQDTESGENKSSDGSSSISKAKDSAVSSRSFRRHRVVIPQEVLCLDEDFFCRMTSCDYRCKDIDTYLNHIKETHDAANVPCPYCSEVLANNDEFGDHMMCHGPNLYACSKEDCCWYSFQKSKVMRHIKDDHQQQGEVKVLRQNLEAELDRFKIESKYFISKDKEKYFICPFCYYQNSTVKGMKNHIYAELHYGRFQCNICKERMCSRKLTMAHFSANHQYHNIKCEVNNNAEIEFLTRCFLTPEVQQKFAEYFESGTVRNEALNLLNEYKCDECKAVFTDIANWHLHWRHCLAKANQPYTCHCSMKFTQGIQLKHHTHKEHPGSPISFTWTENEFWKQTNTRKLQSCKIKFLKELLEPFLREKGVENDKLKTFKYQSKYYKCGYCNFNDTFRCNINKHAAGCHVDQEIKVEKIKNNVNFPEIFVNTKQSLEVESPEPIDVDQPSEKTSYVCSFCDKKTPHLSELEEHVEESHNTESSYPFFYFPDPKWDFSEHDAELYDCAYCSVSQENLFHLKRHCNNLHCDFPFKVRGLRSKDSPTVQCPHCSLKVMSQELLDKHCLFHHPKVSAKQSKDDKSRKQKRSTSDAEEPRAKVKSPNAYRCAYCDDSFLFYIHIIVHQTADHPKEPIKFFRGSADSDVPFDAQIINCDFCSYLGEQKMMHSHLYMMHKNCYVCSYCGQGLNSATSLADHTKECHKDKSVRVVFVHNFANDSPSITASSKSISDSDNEFVSHYGKKPEPIDLHNITVSITSNVSSNYAQLPVIYLSQMFPMFPKVYVKDFKQKITRVYESDI